MFNKEMTMTRKEAERLTHQENTLISLGFTAEEAKQLRRISMTLRRWHELECGTGEGQVSRSIERDGDEPESKPFMRVQYPTANGYHDSRYPVADRETGALKRLAKIIKRRNARITDDHSKDAERFIHATCHAKLSGLVSAYVQGDPRGAALYIIRPGDVPAGADVSAHYNRGICVY
jgi:hypothetical protein